MLNLLLRRKNKKNALPQIEQNNVPVGYYIPSSALELLDTPKRQRYLQVIWESSSLPMNLYQELYLHPLHQYISLTQSFPATEHSYYAYEGGLTDHTLETVVNAVKLAKNYLLPLGADAEEISQQDSAWKAVIFYCALFQSLPLLLDLNIELENSKIWLPTPEIFTQPYRFKFTNENIQTTEQRLSYAAMIAFKLLPSKSISWLNQWPDVIKCLTTYLSGHRMHSGIINEIISEATHLSTIKSPTQTKEDSLQLPGKANCNKSMSNETIITQSKETKINDKSLLGNEFFLWLKEGLQANRLPINTQDSHIHSIANFIFIQTPAIFFDYILENHPDLDGEQLNDMKKLLQKSFESLGHHRKDKGKMFSCNLYSEKINEGKYKKLTGYLIQHIKLYNSNDLVPSRSQSICINEQ